MTAVEPAAVESRFAALEIALRPYGDTERAEIEAAIAGMLSGFRSMRQREDDAITTVAITRSVLRDFPAWAIIAACRKIAQHETRCDPRFAPNDSEIVDVVRLIIKPYRDAFDAVSILINSVVQEAGETSQRSSTRGQTQSPAPSIGDGKHAQRIAADLAARKARREEQSP